MRRTRTGFVSGPGDTGPPAERAGTPVIDLSAAAAPHEGPRVEFNPDGSVKSYAVKHRENRVLQAVMEAGGMELAYNRPSELVMPAKLIMYPDATFSITAGNDHFLGKGAYLGNIASDIEMEGFIYLFHGCPDFTVLKAFSRFFNCAKDFHVLFLSPHLIPLGHFIPRQLQIEIGGVGHWGPLSV